MRRESSEQRCCSATVTGGRSWNTARSLVLAVAAAYPGATAGGSLVPLIAGTAACSTTWTGSVGAVLGKDNASGRLFVRAAPDGMGAARAGLLPGDEVVAIEGRPVSTMTPVEVHEALMGKVGTSVRITVMRDGARVEKVVERGPLAGT